MNESQPACRGGTGREGFLFLLLLGAAAALYQYKLGYSDIWVDEACSKALLRYPVQEMVRLTAGDFHPPLYFIGLKLFTILTGNTDFSIRLFSVLGALSTLAVAYLVGQRVFGRGGALCWSLLLLALPMPGLYSHIARMYTWAAFVTAGVFLYALLYAREHRPRDLLWLGCFSTMAAYLHYYCLIAAFWTCLTVLVYLLVKRDRAWRGMVAMGVVVFILFLPWLFTLLSQARAAQKDFWIGPVSWATVLACYAQPVSGLFRLFAASFVLLVVIYGLTLAALWTAFVSRTAGDRLPLALSLLVCHGTILSAIIVSFLLRPILYPRYVMPLTPLLLVPVLAVLLQWRRLWPKALVLATALGCGMFIMLVEFRFSYGPYRQSLEHLSQTHPEVTKIVHVAEITAGPFDEYGRGGRWRQYYLKNEGSSWYLNMDMFAGVSAIRGVEAVMDKDEVFCLAVFDNLPLNKGNIALLLSQCQLLACDDVVDAKPYPGIKIKLYLLKYRKA
ncbi:MAG TPA: glycosyltransferase family 39 protein [Verrucomicrobiae bacterium]|nr:glycosyltransferase family 39 protein [Verrucomicrobiae bacterium]